MKKYFSRITSDYWTPKNQLEKAAKELARQMDRILMNESEIDDFKKEFQRKIQQLNQKFSRCRPLELTSGYNHHAISNEHDKDVSLSVSGVFYMSLFVVKNEQ